jgi:uncharacterized UBP type Zn finger protein
MQGFPENRARKALILTHDCGTELALHWLIENAESPDIDAPVPESPILGTRSSGEYSLSLSLDLKLIKGHRHMA